MRLIVSIDGPGSSGKSSVGAAAATQLGYRFLDTGVLYRAIAWLSLQRGVEPDRGAALVAIVPELELAEDENGQLRRVLVGGRDVTSRLHDPDVDRRVSAVASQPEVRAALLVTQRRIASERGIIVAGRDIGSVVLPHADLKLFLDVSLEERARRRAAERGHEDDPTELDAIREDLRRRDELDSSRPVAPLRVPDGATVVHSDGRAFEQTVSEVVRLVRAREKELPDA